MTEKRFTHKKWYDDRELFDGDKPFAIVDVYIQAEAICDKLNELAEENIELHIQNDFLKDENQHMRDLVNENRQLKQENKELRGDRDYWKTLAQSLARNNGNVKLKDEHLAWKRVDVE